MVVVTDRSTKLRPHVPPRGTGSDRSKPRRLEPILQWTVVPRRELGMRSAKSTLVWLIGFPLPIILLIALFLHPG
jgi:hypothetical protein